MVAGEIGEDADIEFNSVHPLKSFVYADVRLTPCKRTETPMIKAKIVARNPFDCAMSKPNGNGGETPPRRLCRLPTAEAGETPNAA